MSTASVTLSSAEATPVAVDASAVVAGDIIEGEDIACVPAAAVATCNAQSGDNDFPLAATELLSESSSERSLMIDSENRRAAFASATVLKPNPEAEVGISVEMSVEQGEGSLRVSRIDPDGLFAAAPICVGDTVLSINQTSCKNKDETFFSKLVTESEREVTAVVHTADGDPYLVSTMVTKPSPTSRVGLGFKLVEGYLCVSDIDPTGLFASSILNIGDKCVSIGGISCTCMNPNSAVELIQNEKDSVTLVTRTEQEAGVVLAALTPARRACILNYIPFIVTLIVIVIIALLVARSGSSSSAVPEEEKQCKTLYGVPKPCG